MCTIDLIIEKNEQINIDTYQNAARFPRRGMLPPKYKENDRPVAALMSSKKGRILGTAMSIALRNHCHVNICKEGENNHE